MSHTSITSTRADCVCSLRIHSSGKDELFHFASYVQLLKMLARNCSGDSIEISSCGTLAFIVSTTSRQVHHDRWGATIAVKREKVELEAFGKTGRALKIVPLLELARKVRDRRHQRALIRDTGSDAHYRGQGPVYGIRKSRGGGHYFRRMSTMSERRLNGMTLHEEGEVAPRPSRCGFNLPSNYDDYQVCRQDNWKSQHKGVKSWDRQVTLSKKDKAAQHSALEKGSP